MHKPHREFVESELRKLILPGSFASYVTEGLGAELKRTVNNFAEETLRLGEYMPPLPDGLYLVFDSGWKLDVEWLKWTDGTYKDDNEKEIPQSVPRTYTACEQMAAYGLAVLAEDQFGFLDLDELTETQKAEIGKLSDWRTDVMLDGYKSLVFAQKLQQTQLPHVGRQPSQRLVDFSALGAAGARKRHAPLAELRKWAIDQYRIGKWLSANAAAFDLAKPVIEYGRTIGAYLSSTNAQRTIAEWIRKSV